MWDVSDIFLIGAKTRRVVSRRFCLLRGFAGYAFGLVSLDGGDEGGVEDGSSRESEEGRVDLADLGLEEVWRGLKKY